MQTYNWQDLLNMSEQQIWQLDPGNNPTIKVNARDKSFEILSRLAILSWYCWPLQHAFPGMPLDKRHFATSTRLSNKTILGILTQGYRDYVDLHPGIIDVVTINSMVARAVNNINNTFVMRIPEYVTTGSMRQYLEVLDDPELAAIRHALEPNQNSIREGYKQGLAIIKRPDKFIGNQIAEDIKQGSVSDGQTSQVFIARGYLTDHNSRIFVRPVMACYAEGLGSFYDSFVESRSATKAMLFQKKPLEDSEWFNRKMQLVAQAVQNIHMNEDCGSTITVPVLVKEGWLSRLAGKYYYADDNKTLKCVSDKDDHLIGRIIHMRSPMYCNHADRSGICEKCYGKLAISLPYFNALGHVGKNQIIIGHISATEIGQDLSQKMLSTKHLDTSSTTEPFVPRRQDAMYIIEGMRDNAVRLHPRLKKDKVKLKVNFNKTTALSDIYVAENLDEVATRAGGFNEIVLEFEREGGFTESIPIPTVQGSRQGQFTVDFLRYLQKANWTNAEKGFIVIDLSTFEYDIDVVELPLVHQDMTVYQKQIEAYIRFSKESAKWKGKFITPEDAGLALSEFYSLLSERLKVNIVHAEMMLYSVMTSDPGNYDYRLPRAYEQRQFSSYHECIEFRSLSVQLLYQEQATIMMKPTTFLVKHRQPHPADSIFVD